MRALPGQIEQVLAAEDEIGPGGERGSPTPSTCSYRPRPRLAGAREGAQKLKEVSYVHAEAYQAAETEARPACPDQCLDAERGHRARRRPAVEEHLHDRADQGARRPVIAVASAELPAGLADAVIRGAPRRARARAAAAERPAATARLPRGGQAGPGHRQAAQPWPRASPWSREPRPGPSRSERPGRVSMGPMTDVCRPGRAVMRN